MIVSRREVLCQARRNSLSGNILKTRSLNVRRWATLVFASLTLAIFGGWATAQAANPNSANFTFAGCNWQAAAGFDTGYPVGDASTAHTGGICTMANMHATGDFFGTDNQYYTIYSPWQSTSSSANVVVFYWAYTTWVWDTSQAEYFGNYSSPVSVLAN